ncbi:MAG TPA: peptide ABC transporter substrate-binding protein [Candidatus Paceibacterota bacterium]|nr:peptide ABC transporter substrate-binding protein [Candidatus Paceibacterota bacterium]
MRDFLSRTRSILARTFRVNTLDRLSAYLRSLSAGDRTIATALAVLVIFASLLAVRGLELHFLVTEPAYGGILKEGEVGSPRFVNPLLAISDSDRDLTALTYAGLMGEDGSGNLVPVLAESYTVSGDGKTYTFTLRPDAKFSDGTPVTADDVVFTVEKAQDPNLKSPEYANWSGVAVNAVDARTVEFTLSKPFAPFLGNTTLGILPARLWKSLSDDDFAFSSMNTNPVGAGPFTVSSVGRDANGVIQSFNLKANTRYVLGRPYLAGINFTFYSQESDLQAALANHEVESAYGVPGKSALEAPYSRVFGVFFNAAQQPVFAHKEVREALSIAIDRDTIVNHVLGGYATPLMGPVPPGSGVPDIALPPTATRIADAAQVLTHAGWVYDPDAREWKLAKSSEVLSVTLKTSNVPELKAVATEIQSDWQQLGVPVDIELYEPGDLTQNVIRPRAYGALLFGMVIGNDHDLYAFWDSAERSDPGLNIAMYSNKTVDTLLEKARGESDPAALTDDLTQINADIAADYPAAFTHAPDFLYTVPNGLQGVVLPQITSPSDRFAAVTGWYLETERVWPFLARQ